MNAAPVCVICGEPTKPPFLLCGGDGDRLGVWIREFPGLIREVGVTASRQARLGTGSRGSKGHAEVPLPVNLNAAAVQSTLVTVLVGAARRHGGTATAVLDSRLFLLVNLQRVRASPYAALTYGQVQAARTEAIAVIDRPPDTWYAGKCDRDGTDLYVPVGRVAAVRCRVCGDRYDLATRREQLMRQVRDYRGTASYLAGALSPLLGRAIQPGRLHTLASRGRLQSTGTDGQGRPLYRVGDVLDLLERPEAQRHEGTATRREIPPL